MTATREAEGLHEAGPVDQVDAPSRSWAASLAAIVRSSIFLGAVLTAISWPTGTEALIPKRGLDNSWNAALAMAAHQRLHFGSEIIFNFGPLGFLTGHHLYYTSTAIPAFLFAFALAAAVFAVLISILRTRLNLAVAVLVAFVAGYPLAAVWRGSELVLALMFVVSIHLLARDTDAPFPRVEWLAFGAVAGVMGLQKVSIGVGVALLGLITVACAPSGRRRAAAYAGGTAFGVFVLGWLLTGNRLRDIPAYIRGSKEISTGYPAMAIDPLPGYRHDIWLAVIGMVIFVAVACVFAWRLQTVRRAQAGIVLGSLLVSWVLFKEGFVRQDGHRLVLFASFVVLFAAFARKAGNDEETSRATTWLIVGGLLVTAAVAYNVAGPFPDRLYKPNVALNDLADTVKTLALPSRRNALLTTARAQLATRYGVPPSMVALTAGNTVDIDPIEQTVAWAYPDMRWAPLPTIQDYNAYTSAQDELDVDFLNSSRAPRYILRRKPASIDARLPFFDAPATQLAIACNYQQVDASPVWQLLERGPDRCAPKTDLGVTKARLGDRIDVPPAPPGNITVATIDVHTPLWWRVLDFAYKPPNLNIAVNGEDVKHRYIGATGSQLHMLAVPPGLGYAATFAPKPITSFVLTASDGSTPDVTVHYYAVPIR